MKNVILKFLKRNNLAFSKLVFYFKIIENNKKDLVKLIFRMNYKNHTNHA